MGKRDTDDALLQRAFLAQASHVGFNIVIVGRAESNEGEDDDATLVA